MAKGQKRSNREVRKPKKDHAAVKETDAGKLTARFPNALNENKR